MMMMTVTIIIVAIIIIINIIVLTITRVRIITEALLLVSFLFLTSLLSLLIISNLSFNLLIHPCLFIFFFKFKFQFRKRLWHQYSKKKPQDCRAPFPSSSSTTCIHCSSFPNQQTCGYILPQRVNSRLLLHY